MNCPLCGEVCGCQSEPLPARACEANEPLVDDSAWRGELSARLDRYRARRKMRPPRYPSLSLQFDPVVSPSTRASAKESLEFRTVSNHALALDEMAASVDEGRELHGENSVAIEEAPDTGHPADSCAGPSHGRFPGTAAASAKIIEFPRFAWAPPAPPPDQLAEPVIDRPRILEVPEVAPPPPALGGITIEAAEVPEREKRLGIDSPLQSAAFARRIVASAIDGLIIVAASVMFGGIFWKMTAVRPPMIQFAGLAAGIPVVFWATYQYLLIVYAASTPGLWAAGLALTQFDGSASSRSLRRWRVLASYLSAASLGMGYAWILLDEDALCWHDRITHTYLAARKPQSKREESPKVQSA